MVEVSLDIYTINIKDGKFGELVNAIVEKSSIKNLQWKFPIMRYPLI